MVDFLFIDGDHKEASVESDYANYEPLVKTGGIVAFHDCNEFPGVMAFLERLRGSSGYLSSRVEGAVFRSTATRPGIAYYVKPPGVNLRL